MRDFHEALAWYESHKTTKQIGFNPDGMCLKICRTARNIGSKYGTAKQAQDATPEKYRVHRVRDLRKGMVLFFDDPNDSNKAGHITTMAGRVKGGDPDNLHDVLVWTNSVVKGQLVVVRADYFLQHWGDPFQFGAWILNGVALDYAHGKSNVAAFKKGGPQWDVKLLDKAISNGRKDVKPMRDAIDKIVADLPDDKRSTRVKKFKDYYARHRILKMGLLNDAVTKGDRHGTVKKDRDALRTQIKRVPGS